MHGVAFLSPFKTGNLSAHYDHPALSRSPRHRERDFGMSVDRIETDSFAITKRWATSAIWKRRTAVEPDSTVVSNESSRQCEDSATPRACVTTQPRVNGSYSCAVRKCTRTSGSRVSHRVGWRGVAMRTVACPEVFELSDQVAIPLAGKPRYVTLT